MWRRLRRTKDGSALCLTCRIQNSRPSSSAAPCPRTPNLPDSSTTLPIPVDLAGPREPLPGDVPSRSPALGFAAPGGVWHLDGNGGLTTPQGTRWQVTDARVLSWVARVRVRPVSGGWSRSLLFHPLNTPAPGFRRLKARLRWSAPVADGGGNFAGEAGSIPLTHGASGGVDGGTGLANPHDR